MRYTIAVKYAVIIMAVLLAAVSCTSLSNADLAEEATRVAAELNSGDVDALAAESGTPFLFETEILPAPAQLRALWEGLAASGYDFGPEGAIGILDADGETWRRFSSSREVEAWFRKHAPEDAVIVVVPTDDGRLVLVLDRSKKTRTRIRGLKVENG